MRWCTRPAHVSCSACSGTASAAPEECAAATSGRIQSGGAPSSMRTSFELELRHLRVRAVGGVDDEPAGRDAEDVREERVLNVGGDDGDRVDAEVVEGALREPGLGRGRVGAAREQEERERGRALRRQIPVNRPKMEGKT